MVHQAEPLVVNECLQIPAELLSYDFSRSGGPGGQHVNKTDTRVRLTFDLAADTAIPPAAKERLKRQQAAWLTQEGALVLSSDTHRSRPRNVQEVQERLAEAIRKALVRPKPRIPTKPSKGAKRRRLDAKRRRSEVKSSRRTPRDGD